LVERLNEGLAAGNKLTLVSAPAGSGKTTLIGEWVAGCGRASAWLSLDEADSDPSRFLAYLVAALRTIEPGVGEGLLALLMTPQPPSSEAALTALLNDLTAVSNSMVLVLDDYHLLDARPVDDALAFLVEHLPPQLHLVVATREDPPLPLARLRARGQMTELRGADLRFAPSEAAEFLTQVMHLDLSADDVDTLDARTEGWIVGLQLAAISLQGRSDAGRMIESFAGTNRFILDYLVEEVLRRQPERVQDFLLRTSILDRLSSPLCDATLGDAAAASQEMLEYLERANLFVVPLDGARRWYRYHHLFADLLRQRRRMSPPGEVAEDYVRASEWYEANGFDIEAFESAAAGGDVERAERLIEGKGMPLQNRGALTPVLRWLGSLPTSALDGRPSLWITYASVLLGSGRTDSVEPKLEAAERALGDDEPNPATRDLVGRIATVRAMLALSRGQADSIILQGRRALDYLDPENLPTRTFTTATLGYAYWIKGDRGEALKAYAEARAISRRSGDVVTDVIASIGLGSMLELDNQLHLATEIYQDVLSVAADMPLPVVSEAHLGLARIHYQWNDLEAAEGAWQQGTPLARQLQNSDRLVAWPVFRARLDLAHGNLAAAAAILADAERIAREYDFLLQMPAIAAARVATLLRRGETAAAAQVAGGYDLPLSQARVRLAEGDSASALATLEQHRKRMEKKAWADVLLETVMLQALAVDAQGDTARAVGLLDDAMAMAEPEGFVRMFVDEGVPMARLLYEAQSKGIRRAYVRQLLAAFPATEPGTRTVPAQGKDTRLAEPLSGRELEVLCLVADGLTNQEIAARLFLSTHTIKAHARTINAKLGTGSRTQAAAKARALGLLSPGMRPDA
jgi:LuxR family maltose regulon positive regulatory protein